MKLSAKLSMTVLAIGTALTACGGSGDAGTVSLVDSSMPSIDAPAGGCDPATALPTEWRPIAMISTGTVNVTTANGVTSGTIDATAGGTTAAADAPYIYLDLSTGTKVDSTDTAALTSTAWHIAFKRASIKLNGGDSGPGMVAAASVSAAALADVTTVPGGLAMDDGADASCSLIAGPTGEPASVMSTWYDYDTQTHMLTPKTEVWVLEIAPGVHGKLRITTYDGASGQPTRGAYYGIEWVEPRARRGFRGRSDLRARAVGRARRRRARPVARRDRRVDLRVFGWPRPRPHDVTTTADAVLPTDADGNGVPDFVEEVALRGDEVLARYVTAGFRLPLSDGTFGGDDWLDIYLRNLDGADGNFEADSCTDRPFHCVGYITMENDFAGYGYPTTSLAIPVLTSHELFHAVPGGVRHRPADCVDRGHRGVGRGAGLSRAARLRGFWSPGSWPSRSARSIAAARGSAIPIRMAPRCGRTSSRPATARASSGRPGRAARIAATSRRS